MNKVNTRSARGCANDRPCLSKLSWSIALILGATGNGSAHAMAIETGNPDFEARWDNTIRYTAGWRMEGQNKDFTNSHFYDDTENKFDRGDLVTNRVDLLSELDLVWKRAHGVRVSAAAWYDEAYQGKSEPNKQLVGSGNYTNDHYTSYANRYISGLSGEILDAFAFTSFQLGDVGVNLKAGQHNVYWGESLYSIGNSIAYSQGPVDTIKAASSPGSEAKELFLPLKQISTQISLTDELSLSAQYLLDWKPFRTIPAGSFFAPADGSRSDLGASPAVGMPGGIPNGDDLEPGKKRGDFGLSLRWSPWWLDGTAGLYYRKFDEKVPWSFTQIGLREMAPGVVLAGMPNAIRLNYARDTELYGFSLTKNLATISLAGELSYRKNTALNSASGYTVLAGGNGAAAEASYSEAEGARGNTWHALVNGIYLLPRTPLWTGGTLQAELTYSRLDKITENEGRFNGYGYGCTGPKAYCTTKDAWGVQMGFTPEWPQLFPGWDVSMPTSLAYGLDGNGPAMAGVREDVYSYSIGVTGKYRGVHNFTLRWADSYAPYKINRAQGIVTSDHTNGDAVLNNHGWLSLSYKATF
ncbi:DUF1302 domain-containing protein [Pseudomonas aeruginosa]|uniref:DUF1302 domain-containing protein n=1 Tax=Pseudomonas aeruginosa TaxID=287 RepID=UPI001F163681|nr:DUF1302 domain-containing protein [Pseudomonas aeruginosa]